MCEKIGSVPDKRGQNEIFSKAKPKTFSFTVYC